MREDAKLQTPTPQTWGMLKIWQGAMRCQVQCWGQHSPRPHPLPRPWGQSPWTPAPAWHRHLSSMLRDAAVPKQSPRGPGGPNGGGHRQDRKSHIKITPLNKLGLGSTLPRVQGFSSFPAVFTLLLWRLPRGGSGAAGFTQHQLHQLCPGAALDLLLWLPGTAPLSHSPLTRVPLWHARPVPYGCGMLCARFKSSIPPGRWSYHEGDE